MTVDNTFGSLRTFSEYLIERPHDLAAGSESAAGGSRAALDPAVQAAIDAALAAYDYRWIDDPAEWRTTDLRPVLDGSVIVGVGEIEFDSEGALVPVSLWCGGLCGFWATYRMIQQDATWVLGDYHGSIAMS